MSAERWDLFGLLMKPREDGFWVQHSDYADLERVAKQLRDALENLQQPTTFSEAEQSMKLPMAMGQFIEQVDAANAILNRRIEISNVRAALEAAKEVLNG